MWDRAQLARSRSLARRFDIVVYGTDAEADPAHFDVDKFIDDAVRDLHRADLAGVVSSSDYPGCLLAAILAQRLNLPGPDPESLLRASHKYYSRISQAVSVPESTPQFMLIDPDQVSGPDFRLHYPVFVKPVKSWFSQHARIIGSSNELVEFLASEELRLHLFEFVKPFNSLLARYSEFSSNASHLIAETCMYGQQVTLEGYVFGGLVSTIGIVDSEMYPGTRSFRRFIYPTRLGAGIAERMRVIADLVIRGLGYTHGLFNIELMYNPEADTIHVIEVNPRMCGQFADLMESVNGINTYEILLAVAVGREPHRGHGRLRSRSSASYALRHFGDGVVRSGPLRWRHAPVLGSRAVTLFMTYYASGQQLSTNRKQFDGASYRYAVINARGRTPARIERTVRRAERRSGLIVDDLAEPI
jgi:hypothetical protein